MGGGTSTIMFYVTSSDLRCGPLGLHEGSAILAGKVLVTHMKSSVILLGKDVKRFHSTSISFEARINETTI